MPPKAMQHKKHQPTSINHGKEAKETTFSEGVDIEVWTSSVDQRPFFR
jgi:hypothetical protein